MFFAQEVLPSTVYNVLIRAVSLASVLTLFHAQVVCFFALTLFVAALELMFFAGQ